LVAIQVVLALCVVVNVVGPKVNEKANAPPALPRIATNTYKALWRTSTLQRSPRVDAPFRVPFIAAIQVFY
jgi:hypothetical protein